MQLPIPYSPQLPDPYWRGWVMGPNAQIPGGASALPGGAPIRGLPAPGGGFPAPAVQPQNSQGLIRSLLSKVPGLVSNPFTAGAAALGAGATGTGLALSSVNNKLAKDNLMMDPEGGVMELGSANPKGVIGPLMSRIGNDMVGNANAGVGGPAPAGAAQIPGQATSGLPQIPDLGTTPAYGSFPLPTAQSMAPAGAAPTAAAGGGVPMPRPRPQVPAAPWVNPDAASNFYNGPGSSTFGAGDPSQMAQGPQGQNFNIGALSRFFR